MIYYIKMCLFILGILFGIALMIFFGLIGIIGAYGLIVSLWKYCPEVLIGLGLLTMGILFSTIGWDIFCKFIDKLTDI